jgi:GH15 family glucan-1,4-alpha-glucosidase
VSAGAEERYRPIGDYAMIGDMHSAALISSDGSMDWCCFPHFDDPAVFCRILDSDKGGYFSITPASKSAVSRKYVEESNVLETRHDTAEGAARVFDLMPVEKVAHEEGSKHSLHSVHRILEGLEGTVAFDVVFKPTFGFAENKTDIRVEAGKVVATCGEETLLLSSPAVFAPSGASFVSATVRVRKGEKFCFGLFYFKGEGRDPLKKPSDYQADLDETVAFWRAWLSRCRYRGYHADLVRRSALVLKLLIYEPTGALIAAPTTSLPEEIGGVRNWDYRFSWIRDSTLILSALMELDYQDEALRFFRWIESLQEKASLQIMYTIHGSPDIPERELTHLEGYKKSSPVRVGNAAAAQTQLDRFGQLLNAAYYCYKKIAPPAENIRSFLSGLVDEACLHWKDPDHGIWEVRDRPRHYLHSKLMCWVALDRGIKLAESGVIEGPVERWESVQSEIAEAILKRGFNEKIGAFTQSLDSEVLDASVLTVPLVGLLPFDDPRVLSTTEVIQRRLVSDGLVYRYLSDDGLPGGEGTFLLCTFWLIDNLANQGRLDQAKALFEKVAKYANNAGLYSEEIDPSGGVFLGNFPQGFTHLALIRSAIHIQNADERQRAKRS